MSVPATKAVIVPPADLTELDQWVLWRFHTRDGNRTKVPYQINGRLAKSDSPTTWATFEEVTAVGSHYDGIGFVFCGADPYSGIDLDNCLDDDGALKGWAKPIVERFADTYMEVSPSGRGVKIWVRGKQPAGCRADFEDGKVEIYSRGRFFTVTGKVFANAPLQVEEHQADLDWLMALVSPSNKVVRNRQEELSNCIDIPQGGRHKFLMSYAAWYESQGLPKPVVLATVKGINSSFKAGPKPDKEVEELVNDVFSRPTEKGERIRSQANVVPISGPEPRRKQLPQLEATDGLTIFHADYPEPVFAVPDLLTRGVTLFSGRPKVGKSWLTLQIALSVASGESAATGAKDLFGHFKVGTTGRVVYLALEEPKRRTHARMRKLYQGDPVYLQNLHFIYEIQPLLSGGATMLDEYLTKNPAQLVVIDTFLAIVQASSGRDVLRSDYNEMNHLRELADKHSTAILLVHHLRKAGADYHVDAVAGTTGLSAGCDALWSLKKKADGECLLEITGREMEDKTYGMRLIDGETFGWKVMGEGEEVAMSEERQDILNLLREEGPLKPDAIARKLTKNGGAIRRLLGKMFDSDQITKNRSGLYLIPGNSGNNGGEEHESLPL